MTLPSAAGGPVTEQVGYFAVGAPALAAWIAHGFGAEWTAHPAPVASLDAVVALLTPGTPLVTRDVCVPVGRWTAALNNAPFGTDVGVLPSYAARELGCRALRAVTIDDPAVYPARILEVYGPAGAPPLAMERSIVAANDGGRWVVATTGRAYPFEDQAAYAARAKKRRFTTEMVSAYLRALGVPIDTSPDWACAWMVARTA
jgi:hypothetical protein